MGSKRTEAKIQASCVEVFGLMYRKYAPLLWHTPNGGYRTGREAAKFKRLGVRAGVPDLFLAVPSGAWHGLFVEMKAPGNESTEKQERMQELLIEQGYRVEVCSSVESFLRVVKDYLRQ